jgi:hypothetical protein
MRGRDGWRVGFERLSDALVAQIDVEVVVVPLLLAVMHMAVVMTAMNGRRRLLAVEAQMHVCMCVRDAREENRERGKL